MSRPRSSGYAYTEKGAQLVDCPRCKGAGEVYPVTPIGFGLAPDPELCGYCFGAGQINRWLASHHRPARRK